MTTYTNDISSGLAALDASAHERELTLWESASELLAPYVTKETTKQYDASYHWARLRGRSEREFQAHVFAHATVKLDDPSYRPADYLASSAGIIAAALDNIAAR
jgi:hypothetical protein